MDPHSRNLAEEEILEDIINDAEVNLLWGLVMVYKTSMPRVLGMFGFSHVVFSLMQLSPWETVGH
jgi:hypothetical protein